MELGLGRWPGQGREFFFFFLFLFLFFLSFFFLFFWLFKAAPTAYGSSQARGQITASAAGLHHSHSHTGSKPSLQSTPQFMQDPSPTG